MRTFSRSDVNKLSLVANFKASLIKLTARKYFFLIKEKLFRKYLRINKNKQAKNHVKCCEFL